MLQYEKMIEGLKSGISVNKLEDRKDIAKAAISLEEMDQSAAVNAQDGLSKLNDVVRETLIGVMSAEEFSDMNYTPAQLKAAESVAALAMDPKAAMSRFDDLKAPKSLNNVGKLDGSDFGIEDMVDTSKISLEAFDGQTLKTSLYFSVVYNFMAARQDAFGELFYPTVTIDPAESGYAIEARVINLYTEFDRSITGSVDDKKFNKTSLIKSIKDPKLLTVDRNKVIPVLRDESKHLLLPDLAEIDTTTSEKIKTAPIKIGEKLSLLGISQRDKQLANGVMTNTDSLDRRVSMDKMYVTLKGKDADGNDITETFKIGMGMIPGTNFTISTQGHFKDLMLSFATDGIIFNTSKTTTWDKSGSVLLAGLPSNYNASVRLVVHGDGNTETGSIAVYASSIALDKVTTGAGSEIDESFGEYAAFKELFDTIEVVGYSVEAYTTNSNARQQGQLAGVDISSQLYTVPVRIGNTVIKTLGNENDVENDTAYLSSQVLISGIRLSGEAVNELTKYADNLKHLTANGTVKDVAMMGVSRHFIDAYYNEVSLDVSKAIDSTRSSHKTEDIAAGLRASIKNEVVKMLNESIYGIASTVLNGNQNVKPHVIIGTDPIIKMYLTNGTGKLDLGDDVTCSIESTLNPAIKGKLYMSFGDNSSTRNQKVNPLGFGTCLWSPETNLDIIANKGGAYTRAITAMPRFLHVSQLPILSIFSIYGIDDSLGKNVYQTKTMV